MKRFKQLLFLPLLFFLHHCAKGPSVSNYNYAYLYDEQPAIPRPEFQIFHLSDSVSTLYFKFNSDNILYSKPQNDSVFKAHLNIKYKVYEWDNREVLVDSMTASIMDIGANNNNRILIGKVNLQVPSGKRYFLEVRLRDNNRDLTVLNYSMIDKLPNSNRQYFLIEDVEGQVIFGNVLLSNNKYSIQKSKLLDYPEMNIFKSNEILPLAAPPFVEDNGQFPNFDFRKTGTLNFDSGTSKFQPEPSGIYHFFPEKMENQGFYLYHFRDGFPFISNAEQMIEPLRYISTNEEFTKLKNAADKKKALDEYWLELAGNEDRAREAMAAFYGRIENSNKYFSSNKEGWKTDRGIIYIIYGVPTTIYKTPAFESWIYGEETNVLSLHFKFKKMENPMSNNDFKLMRDIAMKPSWYRAVDSWRQGRVN